MQRQIITAIATVSLFGIFAGPALASKGPVKPNKPGRDHVRVVKSVSAGGAHLNMLGKNAGSATKAPNSHKGSNRAR